MKRVRVEDTASIGLRFRGEAKPLATARDGLQNLRVVDAIVGCAVDIPVRQD